MTETLELFPEGSDQPQSLPRSYNLHIKGNGAHTKLVESIKPIHSGGFGGFSFP